MKRFFQALAAGLAALALTSCGGGDKDLAVAPATNELGPIHIHGMGLNPADDALFVATHTGMFRIGADEEVATRVGDNFQDTMGFTVVGPDRFLGSGHPDLRDDLPPYLGLIESNDAGAGWRHVSLLGDADFHVLEAAGKRVYGFGSDFRTRREQLLVSRDGGREWRSIGFPESILSLAINPANEDEIVISGRRSLYHSTDAGERWQPIPGEPGLVGWPDPELIYLVTGDGAVAVTDSPGAEWRAAGEVGGEPAAFEAEAPDSLYVALHDGAIKLSSDGGRTWNLRSAPGV